MDGASGLTTGWPAGCQTSGFATHPDAKRLQLSGSSQGRGRGVCLTILEDGTPQVPLVGSGMGLGTCAQLASTSRSPSLHCMTRHGRGLVA